MKLIEKNLNLIRNQILTFSNKYSRNPNDIKLIVVSKHQPINVIKEIIKYHQYSFGENFVQEGIKKINLLSHYNYLNWHFIGKLQSNKTRLVAENFSWCHSIDRLNIAYKLNMQLPKYKPKLNVLIQINISNEYNKSGIQLKELQFFSKEISILPNLLLRGIMVFPSQIHDNVYKTTVYQNIAEAFKFLKSQYKTVDTLSLGTSNDIEISIAYGSTMLRIGKAIFDEHYHNNVYDK